MVANSATPVADSEAFCFIFEKAVAGFATSDRFDALLSLFDIVTSSSTVSVFEVVPPAILNPVALAVNVRTMFRMVFT